MDRIVSTLERFLLAVVPPSWDLSLFWIAGPDGGGLKLRVREKQRDGRVLRIEEYFDMIELRLAIRIDHKVPTALCNLLIYLKLQKSPLVTITPVGKDLFRRRLSFLQTRLLEEKIYGRVRVE